MRSPRCKLKENTEIQTVSPLWTILSTIQKNNQNQLGHISVRTMLF